VSVMYKSDEELYSICYWLNMSDVIVRVAPGWDASAIENDARNLMSQTVVGRYILDFVVGDATKMYVRAMLQSARIIRRPLVREYRCDSPDTRRFMKMRLMLEENGLLRWEHGLLKTESFSKRHLFSTINQRGSGRAHFTVRCSMCNAVKVSGVWGDPDEILHSAGEETVPVIYGVCPNCLNSPPANLS
jgi:hypothetical protein